MINNTTMLALVVVAAGLAGAGQAHAGQGSVMLGSTGFAERCDANGGALHDTADGYACELQTTLVTCTFAGAWADCQWNGRQNKLEVVRLIGMLQAESLSDRGSFGRGGKKPGGVQMLDLPLDSKN